MSVLRRKKFGRVYFFYEMQRFVNICKLIMSYKVTTQLYDSFVLKATKTILYF